MIVDDDDWWCWDNDDVEDDYDVAMIAVSNDCDVYIDDYNNDYSAR